MHGTVGNLCFFGNRFGNLRGGDEIPRMNDAGAA